MRASPTRAARPARSAARSRSGPWTRPMDYWLMGELAFTGALVGLMYALVALGIVLVYKTSGVANFAQGAIAMTGGYATWAISAGLGLPMWAAIPLALAMMFALGMLIERGGL